jgi:hypothetical protein
VRPRLVSRKSCVEWMPWKIFQVPLSVLGGIEVCRGRKVPTKAVNSAIKSWEIPVKCARQRCQRILFSCFGISRRGMSYPESSSSCFSIPPPPTLPATSRIAIRFRVYNRGGGGAKEAMLLGGRCRVTNRRERP